MILSLCCAHYILFFNALRRQKTSMTRHFRRQCQKCHHRHHANLASKKQSGQLTLSPRHAVKTQLSVDIDIPKQNAAYAFHRLHLLWSTSDLIYMTTRWVPHNPTEDRSLQKRHLSISLSASTVSVNSISLYPLSHRNPPAIGMWMLIRIWPRVAQGSNIAVASSGSYNCPRSRSMHWLAEAVNSPRQTFSNCDWWPFVASASSLYLTQPRLKFNANIFPPNF